MSEIVRRFDEFSAYRKTLKGDEKGEAQVFCDRLFKAFGHDGYKEAGAELEFRIKGKGKGTSFADLVWKPRLLLEMKKRSENLIFHYKQAFDYWINLVPDRPRYVILCNFDEFWIYDFDKQLNDPVDIVNISELSKRYSALNFMFPIGKKPIFGNDLEESTRQTADNIADLYQSLVKRGIAKDHAQRFVLQLIVAMFAEDIDLMPASTITSIVEDCLQFGQSSYDVFGGLFKQMNSTSLATGGRFAGVPYFNGGLFSQVFPLDLNNDELRLIKNCASKNWAKLDPVIFGSIFQHSMDAEKRHAYGAHYTHEADIQRIVGPSIVKPWKERIKNSKSATELSVLRTELANFKVLDPACGSGNFLYVSFRELVRLETEILLRIRDMVSASYFEKNFKTAVSISPNQMFGIEIDAFGADLAKVTLMIAKKLALDEARKIMCITQEEFGYRDDDALPLDNLDSNILSSDALFCDWPSVDVIISNPPYQSKNKIQQELGVAYMHKLRSKFHDIDGRADYCVYWLRKAHDELKPGQRAGFVGTNTIRQNYSRASGLDKIVDSGGTITEAISSMIWPDEAAVNVSIVNWIKGDQQGKKRLYIQEGNDLKSGWSHKDLDIIGPSLSFSLDVTKAKSLKANSSTGCYQGQTHGHKGFLYTDISDAKLILQKNPGYDKILHPFLIANELIGRVGSKPGRYVIDFHKCDLFEAQSYPELIRKVEKQVLPTRQLAFQKEEDRNNVALSVNPAAKVNLHHANFLKRWWVMSYPREDMIAKLDTMSRYIACGQVTKRPIFEFVSNKIRPNASLVVFAFADDYSFGVLQSDIHWIWFINRCSTLTDRFRYTSNTVFDSFPWPQQPSKAAIKSVAKEAKELREIRTAACIKYNKSLRDIYRLIEKPGENVIKTQQDKLNLAVRKAYGIGPTLDPLDYLLGLNKKLYDQEIKGIPIVGPGVPSSFGEISTLISSDCITA